MTKRTTGRYERTKVGGEEVAAFIPHPLPPAKPPMPLDPALAQRVRAAEQALVRLELAGEMVPSLDWFIYAFVRKEAVLSSQIEGTQATLVDLLAFEAQEGGDPSAAPGADVEEICNYLDALAFTRAELAKPKGLPLSMRLLNKTHERLMHGVRGAEKHPGEVRRTQNWIGGTRPGNAAYVPPRRRMRSVRYSARSRSTSTATTRCRRSCAPGSCTCSSRPSTRTSTATAASGGCS